MEENKNKEGLEQETDNGDEGAKTYTQEEVDALLQQETDRRVTAALKKQEAKNQKKVMEAKKLAAMDEQARYEYELEQREAAIAEKEKELAVAENRTAASKILNDRGIDLSLVDFVVAETAEDMMTNIDLLDKAFKKSVKTEVEKRLAGNTPKKGLAVDKSMTKEQFRKLSYNELVELKTNEPELYASLSK